MISSYATWIRSREGKHAGFIGQSRVAQILLMQNVCTYCSHLGKQGPANMTEYIWVRLQYCRSGELVLQGHQQNSETANCTKIRKGSQSRVRPSTGAQYFKQAMHFDREARHYWKEMILQYGSPSDCSRSRHSFKDRTSTCQIVFHHGWSRLTPTSKWQGTYFGTGWTCPVSTILSATSSQKHDLNREGKPPLQKLYAKCNKFQDL